MDKDQIDERRINVINSFIEKFQRLSPQYQEWFYIAACESDRKYEAMIQMVTKENERQWLKEIREVSAEARAKEQKKAANPHADQSKGLTAQNTAGTGRCGDYTTASRQIQGGI